MKRRWAVGATVAAVLSAAVTIVAVHVAQRQYRHAFAFRIARTTAAYVAAVTPPPPLAAAAATPSVTAVPWAD